MTYSVHQECIRIQTPGRSIQNLSHRVAEVVARSGIDSGVCQVFVQHTSASLMLTENADPDVCLDLERFFSDLVPDGDSRYLHQDEGPDDMSAHVRSVLTDTSLQIPVMDGACALGTWQGVFLWEHRTRPHQRKIVVTVSGMLLS
jgi:secondary thiamine-phosphate synthase enzyme